MINTAATNKSMLEITVNVAASGHDLRGFYPVEDADGRPNESQDKCRKCGRTAWVGEDGLVYNLLGDSCKG